MIEFLKLVGFIFGVCVILASVCAMLFGSDKSEPVVPFHSWLQIDDDLENGSDD